jgi:hypothetical protein
MPLFSPSLHTPSGLPTAEHISAKTDRSTPEFNNRIVVHNTSTGETSSTHSGMVPYKSLMVMAEKGITSDSFSITANNPSVSAQSGGVFTGNGLVRLRIPFGMKIVRMYTTLSAKRGNGTGASCSIDVLRNDISVFSNSTTPSGNLSIASIGASTAAQCYGAISSSATPGSGISTSHAKWDVGDFIGLYVFSAPANSPTALNRWHALKLNIIYYRVP